jgi:uncharacterized protein (DUF433 family)
MSMPNRRPLRAEAQGKIFRLDSSMQDGVGYSAHAKPEGSTTVGEGEVQFYVSGSFGKFTYISPAETVDVDIALFMQSAKKPDVRGLLRGLADKLSEAHPSISTDPEVLGGSPHITGTRLSVGKVLSKLYLYGSVQAVVDIHQPHLSEDQVKEAIAYAQDFLEIACDPHEAP